MIRIGEMEMSVYGLLIGLGAWLALVVSMWAGRRLGVKKLVIENGFWWVMGGGVIGARLYHVADYWEIYQVDLVRVIKVWEGGLGIWGAIGGGVVGLILFYQKNKSRIKLDFFRLLDVTAVGVPLAQAIGRWGNYINGELYGKVTKLPWGINVGVGEEKVHPLFGYESGLNLGLFGLLVWMVNQRKKEDKSGRIAGMYLVGYGVIRLVMENLRPEEVIWRAGGVAVAQMMAGVAILAGIGLWWFRNR